MHSLSCRTTGSDMSAKASALIMIPTRIIWICRAPIMVLVSTWEIMISGLSMLMIKLNSITQHQLKVRSRLRFRVKISPSIRLRSSLSTTQLGRLKHC